MQEQITELRASVTRVSGSKPASAAILVVDDSPAIRMAMVLQLHDLGYHNTCEAADGRVALDMIRRQLFDLILLDIEMPHLDGFGVLDALKNESFIGQLPIIVTSGLDEVEAVVRCITLGAEDYLHKPVNAVLLGARVGASLERKRLRDHERYMTAELQEQKRLLEIEQAKSKLLMLNILPEPIANRLLEGELNIAERHSDVTILFADLVNFTGLANQSDPVDLVALLNDIFTRFDVLADLHGLEKIKTIGDCYVVVGGLPLPQSNHAEAVAEMALAMLRAVEDVNRERRTNLSLRIGVNTGSVVAGVIGRKKFSYDLWGHAVNLASRMESSGVAGRIQVTENTYHLLANAFSFVDGGIVDCKGIGDIQSYFLEGRKEC